MLHCCMPGEDLVLLASSLAISIAKGKTCDELGLLGDLFEAVGQNLALIASKRDACGLCDTCEEDT